MHTSEYPLCICVCYLFVYVCALSAWVRTLFMCVHSVCEHAVYKRVGTLYAYICALCLCVYVLCTYACSWHVCILFLHMWFIHTCVLYVYVCILFMCVHSLDVYVLCAHVPLVRIEASAWCCCSELALVLPFLICMSQASVLESSADSRPLKKLPLKRKQNQTLKPH